MSREVQVRFCESRGVRFPPATHLVIHCDSQDQARQLRARVAERLETLGLELHPGKTRIVCAPRAQKERLHVGRKPRSMRCCVEDEGLLALRRRPSGGGVKPPHAALAEDRRGER
jgi:hypothetical protein